MEELLQGAVAAWRVGLLDWEESMDRHDFVAMSLPFTRCTMFLPCRGTRTFCQLLYSQAVLIVGEANSFAVVPHSKGGASFQSSAEVKEPKCTYNTNTEKHAPVLLSTHYI